jgi:fermentation-respiration switch protein FrsA (DUF1100 family)
MTSILLIPVAVYVGLFIIGAFFSNYVLFRPPTSTYKDGPDIIKLQTASGQTISAKYYEYPGAKYTVLFSNGNGEDIGSVSSFATELSGAGFNVFTYDYRGYGTSEGTPTEQNSYEDAEAAFRYLTGDLGIPLENIIVHGRSLGGGPAMDLASKHTVGGVILESTFTSAFAVPFNMRILPFDKYPNLEKLKNVTSPVLVIHGRLDRTISFIHAERLFAAAPGKKYSFWVDNAGHNNLFYSAREAYLKAIRDFANNLESR